MTAEAVAGLLLTLGLLLYVFSSARAETGEDKSRVAYLRERKDAVYENLRDLNFEYKAGKLSDGDYQGLRDSLESEAGTILAEIEKLEAVEG
jgi:dsDNA-specific endonuclease/ATPase MutS2